MLSNLQNVTEGLRILTGVLAPYVVSELRSRFGTEWWSKGVLTVLFDNQKRGLPDDGDDETLTASLDAARCFI